MKNIIILTLVSFCSFFTFSQGIKDEIKNVKVTKSCFNTEFDEFSPQFVKGKLFISSSKVSSKRSFYDEDPLNHIPFYEVYEVENCKLKPMKFNTRFNDGPIYATSSGKYLFLTQNLKGKKGVFTLGLFICEKTGNDTWSELKPLNINSIEYSIMHPYFDEATSTLYFASNMPGSIGGYDIYKSVKNGDTWSTPVNLGSTINTKDNEGFPYVNDGYFYFSSNKVGGLGGFDLYRQELVSKLINNMGEQFNTAADDLSITFKNDTLGYFSSNRDGGMKNDDIYYFSFSKKKPLFIQLTLTDSKTAIPLESAAIKLVVASRTKECNLSGNSSYGGYLTACKGLFQDDSVSVSVQITKEGFVPFSSTLNLFLPKNDTLTIPLAMESIAPVKKETDYKVGNVMFASGKWDITPTSAKELDKVVNALTEVPEMTMEISSHCDATGSDKLNLELSKKRAEACYNYIIARGKFVPSRVKYYYFGETKLLNHCVNGVKCSKEEHAINRRTEFVFIKP